MAARDAEKKSGGVEDHRDARAPPDCFRVRRQPTGIIHVLRAGSSVNAGQLPLGNAAKRPLTIGSRVASAMFPPGITSQSAEPSRFLGSIGERCHTLAELVFKVSNVGVFRAVAVRDVEVEFRSTFAEKMDTLAAGVCVADFIVDVGPFAGEVGRAPGQLAAQPSCGQVSPARLTLDGRP